MKKIWLYVTTGWQSAVALGLAAVVITVIVLFRIGSLAPGVHTSEHKTNLRNPSYSTIIKDPTNAPYYVARNTVRKVLSIPPITLARLVSAGFGFIAIGSMYYLLSMWYRPRVAVLGTLLFATSSWFLRGARIGLPDILQTLSITLVLLWVLLQREKARQLTFFVAVISAAALIYVPGMLWVLGGAALWRGRYLWHELKKMPTFFVICCTIGGLGLLTPLVIGSIERPTLLMDLAALPTTFAPRQLWENLVSIPVALFFGGFPEPRIAVGNAPLLDVFSSLMLVLGLYSTALSWRLDRNKVTFGLLFAGVIVVTLGGSELLMILLPAVFLLITAGVAYMLEEWLGVFPRNPLARGTATLLMTLAVCLSVFYHLNNNFIAWPHAPATRQAFEQRR